MFKFLKSEYVRVLLYNGTWALKKVKKTKNGRFVKHCGEYGKLLDDGKVDTRYFMFEWRAFN